MGNMREVPRRTKDGIVFDRCMPLGVVMDERIANGHYMAQAFAQIKKYLADPRLMERESLDAEKAAEPERGSGGKSGIIHAFRRVSPRLAAGRPF